MLNPKALITNAKNKKIKIKINAIKMEPRASLKVTDLSESTYKALASKISQYAFPNIHSASIY